MMPEAGLVEAVAEIFAPDGVLAREIAGYEHREAQVWMARGVARALDEDGQHFLAAEAGTGVGKTFAYLIPAALSGRRVVVSTATLNLQEEILNRYIPFMKRHIRPRLAACGIKGRRNYLCLSRFRQLAASRSSLFSKDDELEQLDDWLKESEVGDRSEIDWLADDSALWREVCCDPERCPGARCPDAALCFLTRLRRRAAASDIMVVNHHLFFSDLALKSRGFGEVMPRYEAVIFDEAHHIEDVAGRYFGQGFSSSQARELAADLERGLYEGHDQTLLEEVKLVRSRTDALVDAFPPRSGRYDFSHLMTADSPLPELLARLRDEMISLADILEAAGDSGEGIELARARAESLTESIGAFAAGMDENLVYWGERRQRSVSFNAVPVEIAPLLEEFLYREIHTLIFSSATLTCDGSFDYTSARLGLPEDAETMTLDTPFDYQGRTCLYVPGKGYPEPSDPANAEETAATVVRLAEMCPGGTLALFTSIASMRRCHELIVESGFTMPVFVQGDAPRGHLLEMFRREKRSLLLAVSSFWEGIDVPGESLACVVIDKLPFAVPDDPVVKARSDMVRRHGGNPFADYQVPRAVLSLRQGVGRLMRSGSDYGVMAILDVRLRSKGYGRTFLKSLPPAPLVDSTVEVEEFFRARRG